MVGLLFVVTLPLQPERVVPLGRIRLSSRIELLETDATKRYSALSCAVYWLIPSIISCARFNAFNCFLDFRFILEDCMKLASSGETAIARMTIAITSSTKVKPSFFFFIDNPFKLHPGRSINQPVCQTFYQMLCLNLHYLLLLLLQLLVLRSFQQL